MASHANTVFEQLAVDETGPSEFISRYLPVKMVNVANIAYGGCALGVAISAAYQTVHPKHHLYSALGTYLGPARTDRKLIATIKTIRETRTFATREVQISQKQEGSQPDRLCLIAILDFQTNEPASLLSYSPAPLKLYKIAQDLPTPQQANQDLFVTGKISKDQLDGRTRDSALMHKFFDIRNSPEGVMAQNLGGAAQIPTTQDGLAITDKTSGEHYRLKDGVPSQANHSAALGFMMDASLAFVPMAHSSLPMEMASACSSLEFALRVFVSDIDLNNWHFRELFTIAGGAGRTYSESRLWNNDSTLVASMTQQSILRPAATKL
ncbi:hypothetical protein PFICI_03999 [Pestalotiopsis fici W106-1]|uniref:Acyl-CoA thioesterase II n=1 Tax=Pestalotiopsis fici (strain W106-1 / CGMCC3.15140) TaxID=1229662 RepID=W3XIY3_PESFW|nr:uncharacterized protein PFICI_03999 [Pestalotiopsis fici W106-1]ETS85974.1 hypothetical protein PFICI_03999 [Pestalotiopsis fici W106-1]